MIRGSYLMPNEDILATKTTGGNDFWIDVGHPPKLDAVFLRGGGGCVFVITPLFGEYLIAIHPCSVSCME